MLVINLIILANRYIHNLDRYDIHLLPFTNTRSILADCKACFLYLGIMKSIVLLLIVFSWFSLLTPVLAQSMTRYVSTTGINPNPGGATSWASSTTDLQGAINSLSATGGQVWVATGVYKPGGNANVDRTRSFSLLNNVAVYGGFVGSETALSQRPAIPLSSPTASTLSGEIGNQSIGTPSGTSDNSYHVISNPPGLTSTAVLDGFVITGGNANGFYPHFRGGGMYNNGSESHVCSPTIRHCLFLNNAATYGGAIFNDGFQGVSNPLVMNCLFLNNTASYGGAIYNDGYQGVSNPLLTNCAFQNNVASNYGGALFNAGTESGISSPVLTNCSFQQNSASETGGAMFAIGMAGSSSPSLTNCIVWNNGGMTTFDNPSATVVAQYSLFDAPVTGYISGPGTLTTTTSPFTSTSSARLNNGSPAINAGNPTTTTATGAPSAVGTVDVAGNPRFYNNGRIDMGAYEFQGILEIYTINNGNWSNPDVWSVGRLPQLGERVRLKHWVTIPAGYLALGGTLIYDPVSKLIYNPGGRLQLGQ